MSFVHELSALIKLTKQFQPAVDGGYKATELMKQPVWDNDIIGDETTGDPRAGIVPVAGRPTPKEPPMMRIRPVIIVGTIVPWE